MTGYAEFAVTTNFSFLRGASHGEELALQAKQLGLAGLGVADRNSVAGVVRAHQAAKEAGLPFGAPRAARVLRRHAGQPRLSGEPGRVGRLTQLLTLAKRRTEKGQCQLWRDDLFAHAAGLNCRHAGAIDQGRRDRERKPAGAPRGAPRGGAARVARRQHALSRRRCAPPRPARRHRGRGAGAADRHRRRALPRAGACSLQDVMTCIREHVILANAGCCLEANAERHLKPPQEMARLFRHAPDAVAQTLHLLERCRFSLDELRYEYPDETRAGYATPQEALIAYTEEGARRRYPDGVPPKVRTALDHEYALIATLGYAPYFLTVYDIVRFARSQGILCQGRGSAANSAVPPAWASPRSIGAHRSPVRALRLGRPQRAA